MLVKLTRVCVLKAQMLPNVAAGGQQQVRVSPTGQYRSSYVSTEHVVAVDDEYTNDGKPSGKTLVTMGPQHQLLVDLPIADVAALLGFAAKP